MRLYSSRRGVPGYSAVLDDKERAIKHAAEKGWGSHWEEDKLKRICDVVRRIIKNPKIIRVYMRPYASLIKLWCAFILVLPIRRHLYLKNLWIVGEKGTEARDNGFAFFRYICENHPEINLCYCITKDSSDKQKVEKYGKTVVLNSFRHYVYCLTGKVSANSQPFGAIPEPTNFLFPHVKRLSRKDQIVVHLKHGITKDELPHTMDFQYTRFDLLCCVSERERLFMQEIHGYPDENIKTLGFCRYDALLKEHAVKKQILMMPTHRMWLHALDTANEATQGEKEAFKETEFYKVYSSLLCNADLLESVRKSGYTIVFYLHYALQSYVDCFIQYNNDVILIADRKQYDVQQLLLESSLLVTDFSSVFFDFAYMGKPEVFYQFDEQQYRAGHFKKGYFDYSADGFGPVCHEEREVVDEIKHLLANGCKMSDQYMQRADGFFAYRDTDNCKRVFTEVYRKVMEK